MKFENSKFSVTVISSAFVDKYSEFETLPQAMRFVKGWRNRLERTVLNGAGSFTIYLADKDDNVLGCWEASWWDRKFNW